MKRVKALFAILIFTLGLNAQSLKTIAVLDLAGMGVSAMEAKALTSRLRALLVQTGAVNLVERGQMQAILQEQDFQLAGVASDEAAVEIGMLLGVNYMVAGSIGKLGATFVIDIRLIDVNTGMITRSMLRDYRGDIAGFLSKVMPSLAKEIVSVPALAKSPTTWVEAAQQALSSSGQASSPARKQSMPLKKTDRTPPTIQITSPTITRGMKKVQQDNRVQVRGKASDASGIFEVLVNGVEAQVGADGSFWAEVKLRFGENRIAVKATDMHDNAASTTFTIVREAGSRPAPVAAKDDPIDIGKYYALIIGIDSYTGEWPRLKNAVHDAKGVKEVLESQYRFDHIETLLNQEATRDKIIGKLEWLSEELQEDDNLLIYYSGHGEFKENLNKGYWVPVDATGRSTANYVSNADLQTFLNGIRTRHTLLISDACFSGDIFRSRTTSLSSDDFDSMDRYFQEVYNRSSRQAITSGGIEPVMDGGRDGHSVFTYYFLQALKQNRDPYYDAGQVFERLKIPVANNSEQTPILQAIKNTGDEGGQFIFVRKR